MSAEDHATPAARGLNALLAAMLVLPALQIVSLPASEHDRSSAAAAQARSRAGHVMAQVENFINKCAEEPESQTTEQVSGGRSREIE